MSTNSQGQRRERVRGSKQWRAGAFRNTANVGPGLKSSPLPLLGEFFFADAQRTPPGPLPMHDPREGWARPIDGDFRLTWLGHSTTVLELGGRRVLTDPVFGARASPFSFAGPKRFHAVPASIAQLPPLDAVLLSHDHYDHLCAESVRALAQLDVPVVTALGVGAHLERLGVPERNVHELDWNEAKEVGGVRFTATPAQHFSGRGPGDRNQTLWASWVIEAGRRRVFFSGDTGLTPEFRDLGASFGSFDLVMLEIGAWNQAWGDIHLGPKNALQAFDLLGGGTLFPVHWGTFNLALHAWDEPVETLLASAGSRRIITPKLGLPVVPAHVEGVTPWWREVVAARGPAPLVSEGER